MDILLTEDGDAIYYNKPLTNKQMSCGMINSVSQRLLIRLRTFKGEWFLDKEYGFPYFQKVLGKKVNKSYVDRVYREEILKEQGIVSIIEFNSTLTPDRKYSLNFKFKVSSGLVSEVISIEEYI